MSLNRLDKKKCLELFHKLYFNDLYYPEAIKNRLEECGIEVVVSEDKKTIFIESKAIDVVEPELGEPGILPISIVSVIYELTVGEPPSTNLRGRVYQYQELLQKLQDDWGKDMNQTR